MEKLALVMYRQLLRGSSGERDVLEGYLFKNILALLFFAMFLITVCNLFLALVSVVVILEIRGGVLGLGLFCSTYHSGDGHSCPVSVVLLENYKTILATL